MYYYLTRALFFGILRRMLKPKDFFNDSALASVLFEGSEHVWDGLKNIESYISGHLKANVSEIKRAGTVVAETTVLDNGATVHEGAYIIGERVEVGAESVIEPGACIKEPAIIGPRSQVRHGAYIRGNVLTGPDCVLGHASELKNSALLGGSKAGHFAYIGDSILGAVNLGAGTKLANVKIVDSEITVRVGGKKYHTGLRKFGAIMGDGCRTGCNSTTSPGTLMSRGVLLYPNTAACGFFGPGSIIRSSRNIVRGDEN